MAAPKGFSVISLSCFWLTLAGMREANKLYHVAGCGYGCEQARQAMEWLYSDAGGHIGDELLQAAYALHGKPVVIRVTPTYDKCDYDIPRNIVNIGLYRLQATQFIDAQGMPFTPSFACVLAHELTHAGQPAAEHLGKQKEAAEDEAERQAKKLDTPQVEEAKKQLKMRGRAAPDKATAMQLVGEYFDRFEAPKILLREKFLLHSPAYQEYLERFEKPAVANEIRVAKLRGEPYRPCYRNQGVAPSERQRKIADLAQEFHVTRRFDDFWLPKILRPAIGRDAAASTGTQL